jgi:DNA-binding transcriptional LysR family regulator
MKTRELKALLAIAEELHFSRAAERLGMAQPQLSDLIRRIEDDAGFLIFNRRPRVSVTLAGEVLVASAQRVLKELESASEKGRAIAAGRTGKISLGFVPVVMAGDLAAIVKEFLDNNPNVDLQLIEGTTNCLQDQLRAGEIDFVITRKASHHDATQSLRYAYDEVKLMVPSAHGLAVCDAVEMSDLQQEKLILFPRSAGPYYHDRLLAWCRAAGWSPKISRETESWLAIAGLVGAGFGISFGTKLLSRIVVPGVTYRSLVAPPHDVSFWMSWVADRASPLAERFVQHVRACVAGREAY